MRAIHQHKFVTASRRWTWCRKIQIHSLVLQYGTGKIQIQMVQIWYGVGKCKYNLVQKNIISELILMKINFLLIHRQDLVRKPYPWSKLQNGHNDNFGKILVKKSIFLIIVKICVRYRDILVDVQAKLGLKTNQQAPLPIMQTVASYSRALQRLAEGLLREKKVFFFVFSPFDDSKRAMFETTTIFWHCHYNPPPVRG